MIPLRYRILMNNDIDGLNTLAERAELAVYLGRHPETQAYLDELRNCLTLLDRCHRLALEPPAELSIRIMTAVRGRAEKSDSH